jgi:preprotein translocase subunit Sec61beta
MATIGPMASAVKSGLQQHWRSGDLGEIECRPVLPINAGKAVPFLVILLASLASVPRQGASCLM